MHLETPTSNLVGQKPGIVEPEPSEKIFVSRQPVFDATEKVAGYELLLTESLASAGATAPESVAASARLIVNVFDNFGLNQVLGEHIAFIPISADSLASDFLDLLPPEKIVLGIKPSDVAAADLVGACERLCGKGFRLALDDFPYSQEWKPLFKLASYASFDMRAAKLDTVRTRVAQIEHLPLKRIARNLQSREEFQACKGKSFTLYQGSILAGPETLSMNRVDPSTARVMQLFNLVMSHADLKLIEDSLKHDVALCYSLLCYINSAGFGMPYKVESIRNAIMFLGYDFLWRWLSLLIFAGVDMHAGQRLLLNTALIRGRLTELLGQRVLSQKEGDKLFVVGVFSLLDSLLGMTMEKALANLSLPDEVADALLQRRGKYAPFLELALAFENNALTRAEQLCGELGVDLSAASNDHMTAIDWARQLS
jgi:EAL and modified HD-GYP domain-containing signal transduction protein